MDGTYELFRHFFGAPPHVNSKGQEVAATRGVLSSVLALLEAGATHVGVATDHVIESFRNRMWPGYKTSAGVDPLLLSQFVFTHTYIVALHSNHEAPRRHEGANRMPFFAALGWHDLC